MWGRVVHECVGKRLCGRGCGAWCVGEGCRFSFTSFFFFQMFKKFKKLEKVSFPKLPADFLVLSFFCFQFFLSFCFIFEFLRKTEN